jgi:hypothetical protein
MYIWWGLGKESEADEMERKEMERIESQFVIPSNGDGPIRIEYKYSHIDKHNNWRAREDCYYVYNYKASDSHYMLHYIDSVRFHKWLDSHSHCFYWYNSALPDTISEQSFYGVLHEFKYWEITYNRKWNVYSYWQKGCELSDVPSCLDFKYDTIKNKYVYQ